MSLDNDIIWYMNPDRTMQRLPLTNEIWKHKNGNEYMVLFVTNLDNDNPGHPPDVVYQSVRGQSNWSRPLYTWRDSMEFVRQRYPGLSEVGMTGLYIHSDRDIPRAPKHEDAHVQVPDVGPERKHNWLQGANWSHARWLKALGIKR